MTEHATLPAPPKAATQLLELAIPLDTREFLIGDLTEEYLTTRLPEMGTTRARIWFWKQTLLASYEFMNKQKGGIMAFLLSTLFFFAIMWLLMALSGEISMFLNLPSFVAVVPPALFFAVATTSWNSLKMGIKYTISEQPPASAQQLASMTRCFRVAGDSGILLGIIATLLGAIAMASNITHDTFRDVFGPAFAVCILAPLYAVMFKVLCYTVVQKLEYLGDSHSQ